MPQKHTAAKKRKRTSPLAVIILLVLIAAGVLVVLFARYDLVMGSLFKKGEPIDLRDREVSVRRYNDIARRCPDSLILWNIPIGERRCDCTANAVSVGEFTADEVDNFAYFWDLRSVDARASNSTEAVMRLIETYPALDVSWNVPIGVGKYDNKAEEIAIGDFTADEIERFRYFTSLKRVDATAAVCYPEILALREALPEEIDLKWTVVLGDESFAYTTKELTLPEGISAGEVGEKLAFLPAVRMVDTTKAQFSRDELSGLRELYPSVRFLFKVSIAGESYRSNTENISIAENAPLDLQELLDHGGDFDDLKIINLGSRHMELDDVIAIREAYGGVEVICRATVSGKDFSTDWVDLDLSRRKIEDLGEVEKVIAAMARLEKLYLCDCGFDYETLAALRDKYDGKTQIVWRVYLNGVPCLTDADAFCMSKLSNEWGQLPYRNAEPIKYCTEMVTLDIGHAIELDRIDFVSTMPHLKYLIICGAPVTSLEPLRNSTELYYLEMFFTQVHDLEPILDLPNLQHLNISHCRLNDYTQLFEMTQLKRLWWVDSGLTEAQQKELEAALPDTKIVFWAWNNDAVGNYWRDDPSYREMRDNLGMNYNVIA